MTVFELRGCEPAEMLGPKHLAVAPVIIAPNDGGIELSAIECVQQYARMVHPYFYGQAGVVGV